LIRLCWSLRNFTTSSVDWTKVSTMAKTSSAHGDWIGATGLNATQRLPAEDGN
jgi:hypothetical protein